MLLFDSLIDALAVIPDQRSCDALAEMSGQRSCDTLAVRWSRRFLDVQFSFAAFLGSFPITIDFLPQCAHARLPLAICAPSKTLCRRHRALDVVPG
jgi:hypothetical protein